MNALRVPVAGALIAAAAIGGVAAFAPGATQAQQSMTINLSEQNDSDQTGTAVLTPDGGGTRVVITLSNAPGPHPAHIHTGQCPTPGAVVYPLTSVAGGTSETTVNATMEQLMAAPHAINVHKSPQEASVYTSCGNITAAAPAAQPTPAAKPGGAPAQPGPAPAAKPGGAPAQAGAQSPAAKPGGAPAQAPAAKPAGAPAQAPRPMASPAPAGLPRTGEAETPPFAILGALGGLSLIAAGAFVIRRRRTSSL